MSVFEIAILVVMGYVAVFGIVNRICGCIEQCAAARHSGERGVINEALRKCIESIQELRNDLNDHIWADEKNA